MGLVLIEFGFYGLACFGWIVCVVEVCFFVCFWLWFDFVLDIWLGFWVFGCVGWLCLFCGFGFGGLYRWFIVLRLLLGLM